jgi:mannose-1-phosphate guanylyltransferase/phosphomannomutase
MVPIVNKSVISHILDLLASHGVTEVVVTLRYMAAAIQNFLETSAYRGMEITYSVEEMPLGTAGSVKNAAVLLGDEPFLVISGDALTDFDLGEIVRAHESSGSLATLTLTHVANPLEYGVIVTDSQGFVTQFLEKPTWGEVISDTVNTGIYVLDPEVLAYIPDNTPFDFSQDLFPAMMAAGDSIYGHIANGYWCDVGNIEEYMQANADVLAGKVALPQPIGEHIGGGVWIGKEVEIAPSAQLYGPIYLGNEVKIKGDVIIHGPAVIRDSTVIDNFSRIERSILWRNNYVGESCELHGVIVSRQCSIKAKVMAFEGAVIGDNCILGEGCLIDANVKLWPRKKIEAGAEVRESIIWGSQGRRTLFSRFGVSGVINIDITSEFAAKLGAALGATLPKGSYVAINRDTHRASRMIKRALISGLPGAGVNVLDMQTVAIPVLRYYVRGHDQVKSGIHVRLSPFDQRVIDIRFTDANGLNLSSTAERKIERMFFREDFRRAYFNEIGSIEYTRNSVEEYSQAFLANIDVDAIRKREFKLVVDYSYGLASDTLSGILAHLNIDVLPLNARMDEAKLAVLEEEFHNNRVRMGKIVHALGADLGVQLGVGGEKLYVVDDKGRNLDDDRAAALIAELTLFVNPGGTIAVPINACNAFDEIATWHEGSVFRIRRHLHSMMSAAGSVGVLMVTDTAGNFIFPDFQPVVDGMFTVVRLLEYLARRAMPASQVVDYLPVPHLAQKQVHSPWEVKGAVMRLLNEEYRETNVEKIDGIKIHLDDDAWVHITPNPERPLFELVAEAADDELAHTLVEEYRLKVESYIAAAQEALNPSSA